MSADIFQDVLLPNTYQKRIKRCVEKIWKIVKENNFKYKVDGGMVRIKGYGSFWKNIDKIDDAVHVENILWKMEKKLYGIKN
jgi:hypothetical protein